MKIFRITILFLVVCGLLTVSALTKEKQIRVAPLNPAFVEYLEQVKAGKRPLLFTEEGHALGLIPSPIDMSHTRGYRPPSGYRRVFQPPSSYDLRPSLVTPVRNQGACGSCWAFATYGSLESWLLVDPGKTWDFSENNLKECHGFNSRGCSGGNRWMSTAYLAQWKGPIDESDDPYVASDVSCTTGLTEKKHLETVLMVPDRPSTISSLDDIKDIKQAVMDYGAMYTSMYWSDTYYNADEHTYYYDGTGSKKSNHAVAIVGWDNSFDKTLFTPAAPDDGAWIVRNSWGDAWGEGGYFYASYYDSNIGKDNASFINAWDPDPTGGLEQYDPLGNISNLGYLGSHTGWGANIFIPPTNETLKSVGFYNRDTNASYEIYIYNTFSGGSFSNLLGTKSGSLTYPGYYTIDLNSTIPRDAGDDFAIVIKFTTPTYDFPIPVERPISGYSSGATANAGESYVSSDGSTWTDITTVPLPNYNNANVCIKGIMTDVQPLAPVLAEMPSSTTGNYTVAWTGVTGVTAYELQELSGRSVALSDNAEGSITDNWTAGGFYSSSAHSHSGSKSYYSGLLGDDSVSTLTLSTPIALLAGSAGYLEFYSYYRIRSGDLLTVKISDDGGATWDDLDTFSGSQLSWIKSSYCLDNYVGSPIYLRFEYDTGSGTHYEGFYVDDIKVTTFTTATTLSNTLTETYYPVTGRGSGTYYYRLRAQRASLWSNWSNIEGVSVTAPASSGKSGSRCFIATAAYGGYTDSHRFITDLHRSPITDHRSPITILERFRDEYLLTNPIGRAFVSTYNRISPPIADFIRDKEMLKAVVRAGLKPVVWIAKKILK